MHRFFALRYLTTIFCSNKDSLGVYGYLLTTANVLRAIEHYTQWSFQMIFIATISFVLIRR